MAAVRVEVVLVFPGWQRLRTDCLALPTLLDTLLTNRQARGRSRQRMYSATRCSPCTLTTNRARMNASSANGLTDCDTNTQGANCPVIQRSPHEPSTPIGYVAARLGGNVG